MALAKRLYQRFHFWNFPSTLSLRSDGCAGTDGMLKSTISVTHEIGPLCEERAQVEHLLADPLFSQSKRYGAFLRYVTERALSHNQEPHSERTLGVEIFGRSPNYDTDADPIVRVTASELRKRLAHYYGDPAHAAEIHVVLHKGSYLAEFVAPGTQPPPMEAPVPLTPLPAPTPAPAPEPVKKRRWYYISVLAGALVLLTVAVRIIRPQQTIFEQFWRPVLVGPHDLLLSIPQFSDHVHLEGVDNPMLTWSDPLTPTPDGMNVPWTLYSQRLVHISDVTVATRMAEFLGSRGKHAVLKGEHDLTMRDLRATPAVILGGLTNQWTSQLLAQARFRFDGDGSIRFIRDSEHPENRPWSFDSKVRSGDRAKDFIIISRVADSVSGRVTVLAGGFSVWGTQAAVELLTDADQMRSVLANAPRKWDAKNVQIVLECAVVRRESGVARFLAANYW